MKQLITLSFFLAFGNAVAQPLQLAPPQTASTRLSAKAGQTVAFDFRLEGAEIRYTTDGSDPTAASPVYTKPLKIKGLQAIQAKSFKPGFLPSDATTVQLVKPGKVAIDSLTISPAPKKYVANGWKTLCDGQLGDDNFHENWLGFDATEVTATLFFKKKTKVSKISVGYLQQQGAWIFGPASVRVFDENGQLLASLTLARAAEQQASGLSFISTALPEGKYKSLTVKVLALPAIPDWHPGKGSPGWLFLDEVLMW